jgi:hypothetical protein
MLKRIFNPFHMRRSLIIFGPMNLGLWPAVKKAERYFKKLSGKPLTPSLSPWGEGKGEGEISNILR